MFKFIRNYFNLSHKSNISPKTVDEHITEINNIIRPTDFIDVKLVSNRPLPKFSKGNKVLVNPMGSLGHWCFVDRNPYIDTTNIAVIVAVEWQDVDADADMGCLTKHSEEFFKGYWSYKLRWKTTKPNTARPKYSFPEAFLIDAYGEDANILRAYWKNEARWNKIARNYQEDVEKLEHIMIPLSEHLHNLNDIRTDKYFVKG